jgi:[protein-PII] uridylyltransferase
VPASRALRLEIKQGRAALAASFLARPHPQRYLQLHAKLVDQILRGLCNRLLPDSTCLVAVGGYGRGELFPASDVDVLLLIPQQPDAALKSSLEIWVQNCWDAGLEIGHSIRTPEECAQEASHDITIETALLEARLVWGSQNLFDHFRNLFQSRFNAARFIESKLLEQRNRHHRFEDSAYNLEPNLKDSPGGLRDLHMIGWLVQAASVKLDPRLTPGGRAASGNIYARLVRMGLLAGNDAQKLIRVQGALNLLRIHLHLIAKRREDRLAFDYQSQLAINLGIGATQKRRASELLMQRYYRAAKQVQIANELLLPAIHELVSSERYPVIALDAEFSMRGNMLALRDPELFTRDPGALFRAFLSASRHGITAFDPATLRGLWRGRLSVNRAFRESAANRAGFIELLRQPQGITWAISMMARYGILGRYIPAFGRISGQMQHDGFHIYTVDEHTLAVLRNVRRFAVEVFAHEYPLASKLIATFNKPELLYLAALFHDIAKGRGGDHSELGTRDARAFCNNHGLPEEDVKLVAWLVREHLSMSRTAQKEDLSDSGVIERFAARAGDMRHLDALYILTVADIRGTSPKVWNAWKGKLLENLYHATRIRITGQAATGLPEKQAEARAKLALYGILPSAADNFWKSLDDSYFLRFDTQDIAWHARMLWQKADSRHPVVRARLSPAGDGIQVLVYCPDMPDLFTRVCGFLARNQFSVVEAKIHTTQQGYALDSFQVLDDGQREVHYRDFLQFVEHELVRALDPGAPPEPVPAGRLSRRLRHFPIQPEVEIRPDEQGRYFVLSITCGDRVGLLHGIAQNFLQHGVELYSAKIHTLGERVEDRFLIRGEPLKSEKNKLALEKSLLDTLNQASA